MRKNYYRSRSQGHDTTDKVIRAIIRKRYKDICYLCGRKYNRRLSKYMPEKYFNRIEIDHIIPYSRGGRNHISNYALSCKECNRNDMCISMTFYNGLC